LLRSRRLAVSPLRRVLGTYPLLRVWPLRVPLLQRVTLDGAQSNQRLSAPASGASPRLGVPSLRHCSGGTPPQAIHGLGRLARHPCRAAPCATPALGLLKGQGDQEQDHKPKPKRVVRAFVAGLPAKRPVRHASPWLTPSLASQLLRDGGGDTRFHLQAGRKTAVRFCFCF